MVIVRKRKENRSRGAAAVEAALGLPIILLVTFGAIRYGWFFLKAQQITNAARYGARIAVRASIFYTDASDNDVINHINNLMASAGMGESGYSVTITCPSGNWYESPVGQDITVKVSVPAANVDLLH